MKWNYALININKFIQSNHVTSYVRVDDMYALCEMLSMKINNQRIKYDNKKNINLFVWDDNTLLGIQCFQIITILDPD